MLILIETVHLQYLSTCLKSYLYCIGDARSVSDAEIPVIFCDLLFIGIVIKSILFPEVYHLHKIQIRY